MVPSELPALAAYPCLRQFVAHHLDMQFDDVRTMLQLPRPSAGLTGGCNFAAVATLCNLVSGISEVLYTPPAPPRESLQALLWRRMRCRPPSGGRGSGAKFRELLVDYYPWAAAETPQQRRERAAVLYRFARNPLAHSLGVLPRSRRLGMTLTKLPTPVTADQLEAIEASPSPPTGLPPAFSRAGAGWTISAEGLYWGVFHLLGRLTEDNGQMQLAEARFSTSPR